MFLREFGAYFDVDVINISNPTSLDEDASACAGDYFRRQPDTQQLIFELKKFLISWDADTIQELKKCTCVDWQFSQEAENALKHILAKIISDLES